MSWLNKTVWITGASSGIGRAVANRWAELGARVILSSRKEEALQEVANQWTEEQRSQSFILPLDLSQSEQLPGKVAEALQWAGTIDVMVHCGGISHVPLYWRLPWRWTGVSWRWITSVRWP